jgi:hypothetical protein
MAQFFSLPKASFPSIGTAVDGALYYATDTKELFVGAQGYLFPVSGILSAGMQLSAVGPQGPQGPPGETGIPTNEQIGSIDLLKEQR